MSLQQRLAEVLGGGYAIESELGGGMARLFLARDVTLDRRVVVKVFEGTRDPSAVKRFLREIQFVAALQHPQIVGVIAAGEVDGAPYYLMPFVDGESVRHRLATGALPVRETVSILRDIARGLAYAHERHIVHRDIKPDNILLAGASAVLTDFGIAKPLDADKDAPKDASLTNVGFTVGTPAYMPPEQVTGGALDGRSDLYALGMTAWEMLVGRAPFAGREAPAQMMAQMNERPDDLATLRPDVPAGLARLVMQMVEKDIARRPESAQVLIASLEDPAIISGVFTPGTVRTVVTATAGASRRRLMVQAVVATVLIGAAGVSLLVWRWRGGAAKPVPSVAVLPLAAAGATGSDSMVIEGLADELGLALGRIPGVRVAPPAATAGLAALGAQAIGQRLAVATVLTGNGQLQGGALRLSLQLVDAKDGTLLWGDRFEGRAADLFRMQDSVAAAVEGAFRRKFGLAGAAAGPGAWGTQDAEAYEDFLRGHVLFTRRRAGDLHGAIEALHRATTRDSMFARAFAALADVYSVLPTYGLMAQDSANALAFTAVDRALAIDPQLAAALASRGNLRLRAWRWADAERDLADAVRADSTSAQAWQWYGELLMLTRRPDSAAAVFRRASRLDVASAISPALVSLTLGVTGKTRQALAWNDTAEARDSLFIVPPLFRAMVFLYAGRARDALEPLRKAAVTGDPRHFVDGIQAYALAAAGQAGDARALLHALEGKQSELGAPAALFRGYAGLRDNAKALDWFEKAWAQRDPMFFSEPLYAPIYAGLQGEPRFQAVLRQAGLAAAR